MPRYDNGTSEVIDLFRLRFDPADPGRTSPVDLCRTCAGALQRFPDACLGVKRPGLSPDMECDHPPYEEQEPAYKCRRCGNKLTVADN